MSNGTGYQSHSANLALEILEIFLQQLNVQVDVCDRDGRQPLLWAASAGAAKAVLVSKYYELISLQNVQILNRSYLSIADAGESWRSHRKCR